jgi:hypothetical protein
LTTDVDAVTYLMLVNDVIHGLYPEAVSIGEDVCHPVGIILSTFIFPFFSLMWNVENRFNSLVIS